MNIKKLRKYVLWYGNDTEVASMIAKFLFDNNEEVYNYYETIEMKHTSSQWLFLEYEETRYKWTRSADDETLKNRPRKDMFSRKAKLEKLNKIAKRRNVTK